MATDAETIAELQRNLNDMTAERNRLSVEITSIRNESSSSWTDSAKSLLTYLLNNKTAVVAAILAIWGAYREFRPNTPPPDPAAVERLLERVQAVEKMKTEPVDKTPVGDGKVKTNVPEEGGAAKGSE